MQSTRRKPFRPDLDFMNKGLAFLGELCAFARKLILFLALRLNFFVYFVVFVERWF
jgi:hypothetical protein